MVEILIDMGSDIARPDEYGNTSLHISVQKDYTETTQKNLADSESEHLKIFQLILDCAKQRGIGDYVLRVNNFNKNALHCAIEMNYNKIVQILLDNGADLDCKDGDGKNSMHLAAENDDFEMALVLIKIKKIQIKKKYLALQAGIEDEVLINFNEYFVSELQKYLDKKIEVVGEFLGARPIHFAVISNNAEIVKLLVEYNVDVNSILFKNFSTPLHIATENNNIEIAKILLDANCVRVFYDANGQDAFYIAVKNGNFELIKLFFDYGIEFDQTIQLLGDHSDNISSHTFYFLKYLSRYRDISDEFSKAYKQLKHDLTINVNARDALNFPTFNLIERYIFDNPKNEDGFNEAIKMSDEVINFISQKPQILEFFDKISSNFLQQCANHAIAGFTRIATYVAMVNQIDIDQKLEVTKRIQVMEIINFEVVKKLSEISRDQIPNFSPLTQIEIILANKVLEIIHKKWLEKNKKLKIDDDQGVLDLEGPKPDDLDIKISYKPWLGVSLFTYEEGHSYHNPFEEFINRISKEIGSKEGLIEMISEVLSAPLNTEFVDAIFSYEKGHDNFTAEFLTLILIDDETRNVLQQDQKKIRLMIDNCDTTLPDYYGQLQSLSKQLHQAQQDYSDKIKSIAKEIILDQLIPKKRPIDIDSLLNPSSPNPYVSDSKSLLQITKLQRF